MLVSDELTSGQKSQIHYKIKFCDFSTFWDVSQGVFHPEEGINLSI